MEPIYPSSVDDNTPVIPGTPSPTYESSCCPGGPASAGPFLAALGGPGGAPMLQVPRFFPFAPAVVLHPHRVGDQADTRGGLLLPQHHQQQPDAPSASSPAARTTADVGGGGGRSLLEDLRLSPSDFLASRSLPEVFGEASDFACDQYGSRFLQTSMEKANGAEIHGLFLALLPSVGQLSVDPFGNYVVQKLLEILSDEHRQAVGEQLLGQVVALSTNTYGCRVVQKLLEVLKSQSQSQSSGSALAAAIGRELEHHVLELIEDQNGNHVIQQSIQHMDKVDFVLREVKTHVARLALHCYGCRVIQRLLERFCSSGGSGGGGGFVVEEVLEKVWKLSVDQFGNYVVQHVLMYGDNLQRDAVVRTVADRVVEFSCHKYASNVAERALVVASESGRALIIAALLKPSSPQGGGGGEPAILALTRDRYANYVIQRCIQVSTGSQKTEVVRILKSQVANLKKVVYGKHIIAAIEKLEFRA